MATKSKYDIYPPNRTYNDWDTIEQQIKQSGSDIFATKEDLEALKQILLNDTYPIGMILCASVHPNIGTWSDITSSFEGRYLRLGKNGELTAEGLPDPEIGCVKSGDHTHTVTVSSNGKHTHTRGTMDITGKVTAILMDDGQSFSWSGALYNAGAPRSRSWSSTSGDAMRSLGFQASKNWTGNTSEASDHTHTVTIDNNGEHYHNLVVQSEIYQGHTHVEPLGYGIKIWRRDS